MEDSKIFQLTELHIYLSARHFNTDSEEIKHTFIVFVQCKVVIDKIQNRESTCGANNLMTLQASFCKLRQLVFKILLFPLIKK